ncbi:MAG: ribose 5-phosphate isomerase A [Legionellales bacterium]|nr:ribose 5-phosphate isomerase A [Legionellales bacterium]
MTDQQDLAKTMLAEHALSLLEGHRVIGLGAGSTVMKVIDAIAASKRVLPTVIVASLATLDRCRSSGIEAELMQSVSHIDLYIDGADEVDSSFCCIKGKGGAMTGEKLCAEMAAEFIVLVDQTKLVQSLGSHWPVIAIEVVPWARSSVGRAIVKLGGKPVLRAEKSDMGNEIIDCHGLDFAAPYTLSDRLNQITGVVAHGLFVHEKPTQVFSSDGNTVKALTIE